MTKITFENKTFETNGNESVLDCLVRSGENITNSCRSGICQSCILKSTSNLSGESQKGLSEAKKRAGLFLSCQEVPKSDLEVFSPDTSTFLIEAKVIEQRIVSDSVVVLKIAPVQELDYKAGQFVNLIRSDGLCRSYSIASKTGEKELEFHIRKVPDGRMSSWFFDEKLEGETIEISDPLGECYLSDEMNEKDLLLVGVGTGLAPLYGVVQDCIQLGRNRKVSLFHGGLNFESLYFVDELQDLSQKNDFFTYQPVYLKGDAREGFMQGDLVQLIKELDYDKSNTVVMVCGDPFLVKKLKQEIFLSGVSSKNILSDPFISPTNNEKP